MRSHRVLAAPGPLCFYVNLDSACLFPRARLLGFRWLALRLQVSLGSADVLMILSFPTHEQGMVSLFTCLGLPQFPLAVSCSLQCTN